MRNFHIIARKGRSTRRKDTIRAASAPKALRAYGCNVKGSKRSVKTKRGTVITAIPA